ncbi:hypothetical protein [Tissierella sp.]|uniref:hypothetical protein n=1 Tax=Tissierella sp. TaxID=41274 RepID=UPI0028644BC2|nr:hypothetical protein [Tissierella sp.]MDR7856021.1 hypothetical protein [Tissierella sp.]
MDLTMKSLVDDVKIARNKLNEISITEPDHMDNAIYKLNEAEEKLNNYIREKKHKEQIEKTFQLPTEKGLR